MNALSCSAWLGGKDTTIPRGHPSSWDLDTSRALLDICSFLCLTSCFLKLHVPFLDSFPADDEQARLRMLTAPTALVMKTVLTPASNSQWSCWREIQTQTSPYCPPLSIRLCSLAPAPSPNSISIIGETRCLARFWRYDLFVVLWQSRCATHSGRSLCLRVGLNDSSTRG